MIFFKKEKIKDSKFFQRVREKNKKKKGSKQPKKKKKKNRKNQFSYQKKKRKTCERLGLGEFYSNFLVNCN